MLYEHSHRQYWTNESGCISTKPCRKSGQRGDLAHVHVCPLLVHRMKRTPLRLWISRGPAPGHLFSSTSSADSNVPRPGKQSPLSGSSVLWPVSVFSYRHVHTSSLLDVIICWKVSFLHQNGICFVVETVPVLSVCIRHSTVSAT